MKNRKREIIKTAIGNPTTGSHVLRGQFFIDIERNDPSWGNERGRLDKIISRNVVVQNGLSMMARWISSYGYGANSQMAYMAVGTATTAGSVNQTNLAGEVKRLAFSSVSVTANNSWSAVTTFGGGSDSLTNVIVGEAGVWNAAGSGAGIMLNRAPLSATFTLQNSDIATVQVIISVGSL